MENYVELLQEVGARELDVILSDFEVEFKGAASVTLVFA